MEIIELELSNLCRENHEMPSPSSSRSDATPTPASSQHGDARFAPEDLHFLAVLQHALDKRDEAKISYERALEAYREIVKKGESAPPAVRILSALCTADHGEFLMSKLREPKLAADEFEKARDAIAPPVSLEERNAQVNREEFASAFFRIYMLCKEAEASLAINHWSRANDRLTDAVNAANASATGHFLEAHVHHKRAWAEIIQWRIQEAICSFKRSNQILDEQFVRDARAVICMSMQHQTRTALSWPKYRRIPTIYLQARPMFCREPHRRDQFKTMIAI